VEAVRVSGRSYPSLCDICGARAVRLTSQPLPMEYREGTFAVEGFEYERCGACGESFIDAAQMDDIQRAGVEAARVGLGRLSSADIRAMRLTLGITQAVLEGQLGVSAGTVGRWERGEELQTRIADNFMRLLSAHPELVAEAAGAVARESRGPYRPRR
jgi:putative zinc finger/helix-turn-helix YgiT family protein